jgi:hypothetical protein
MNFTPFTDSSSDLAHPDTLRERMQKEGYLYFSGLLPKEATSPLYRAILALCREAGWADAEDRAQGEPRLEGTSPWWEVYDPLQKLELFHALPHRSELMDVLEVLTEEPVLVHPRNIARITFPGATFFTTPAHQDHPLIQGTPDTYTAWIPLSDCPGVLGGLAVLEGSHQFGLLPVHRATGPGGLTVDTDIPGCVWRSQDMKEGDVLLFHSLTVHAARPNITADSLRVSVDYRYQGVSQPVVADSLEPHYGRMTWEEIFKDWTSNLPWYWSRQPLNIVARNLALQTPVQKQSGANQEGTPVG